MRELKNCPDCFQRPGLPHVPGCDVERCSVCGSQRLSGCNCKGHDKWFSRWMGIWPGAAESEYLGIDLNQFYRLHLHKFFFIKPKRRK